MELKVTRVAGSLAVILPREILQHLGVKQGDNLYVAEGPDGVTLSRKDVETRRHLDNSREILRRRRLTETG